jgi:hypothetical protein
MKFPSRQTSNFELCPAGTHVAICNAVVDLGLQTQRGQYGGVKHEVYVRWELPDLPITYTKDGKELTGPMSIGRSYTASMSEKANLRKLVEGWFAKKFPSQTAADNFEFSSLLGKTCLLNVTHTEGERVYANVASASPLPASMKSNAKQYNPSLHYSLDEPDEKAFSMLPNWLQDKINGRVNAQPVHYNKPYEREQMRQVEKGAKEATTTPDDFADDIPF